jgi:hypothetical protein
MARAIHEAVGVNVCVTAGIHLDGITREEIATVLRTVEEAVSLLIARLVETG